VDLVVVGSRELGTVKGLVLSSVSEGGVGLVPCPALMMRGGFWPLREVLIGNDSSEAREAGEIAAWLVGL
jgi:hypothetical protein